jgi:hypothetical protein
MAAGDHDQLDEVPVQVIDVPAKDDIPRRAGGPERRIGLPSAAPRSPRLARAMGTGTLDVLSRQPTLVERAFPLDQRFPDGKLWTVSPPVAPII